MRGDGKDGHTLRRVGWKEGGDDHHAAVLRGLTWARVPDRHHRTLECGVYEVAVSSVDLLLSDPMFTLCSYKTRTARRQPTVIPWGGNLNKRRRWELVRDELEATCVSKETHIHARDDKMYRNAIVYHRYTVPVIGHQVSLPVLPDERFDCGGGALVGESEHGRRGSQFCDSATTEAGVAELRRRAAALAAVRDPKRFFSWRGGMYDAGLLYQMDKHENEDGSNDYTFTALGRLEPPPPPEALEIERVCRAEYNGYFRDGRNYGGRRTGARYKCGKARDGGANWIEFDLMRSRQITHLGVAGELPPHENFGRGCGPRVVRYRKRRSVGNQRIDGVLRASGDFASEIKVVPQKHQVSEAAWVTKLNVQYRVVVGGKTSDWVDLVMGRQCNYDAYSEVLIDLTPVHMVGAEGLECRQIRVRPTDWHNRPAMRLAIYGPASAAKSDNRTIVYTLSEPIAERRAAAIPSRRFRRIHDGPITPQCRDPTIVRRRKARKRAALGRKIREETAQWDEDR